MNNDSRDLVVIKQIMALQNKTTKELNELVRSGLKLEVQL
jgi:hypothetical protein